MYLFPFVFLLLINFLQATPPLLRITSAAFDEYVSNPAKPVPFVK